MAFEWAPNELGRKMFPTVNRIKVSFNCGFALPLLVWGVAGHGAIALAQLPDTFTGTGDMTTARYAHTATLLLNGKVLIAGGGAYSPSLDDPYGSISLASAELYDPSTGTFTATGDMTTPRQWHTATLLPNGKVLIVGGESCNNAARCLLASAELYDPSSGFFIATGNMTTARWGYTATLLNNGSVLIAGGSPPGAWASASAELYDPSTDTFTATSNMTTPRAWHTATLLANGKVLITGSGVWSGGVPGTELYDPDAGAFRGVGGTIPSGPFGEPRTTATLTVLMNGKVLAMLEGAEGGDPDGAAVYDPTTEAFTSTGDTTVFTYTATLLPDGTVLVAGYPLNIPESFRYDPATGIFYTTGDMATHRLHQTATLLPDGTVMMSGGNTLSATLSTAELFHPKVLVPSPVLLSISGDGRGQGAIQHAGTVRIASASDPAVAGEYLSIYLTGLADGSAIPPQLAIGGRIAKITFFGNVPGYPGLNLVNVQMPNGVSPGPGVSVRLTYLNRVSNEVNIGVQ